MQPSGTIALRSVSKSYGSKLVLNDVSLTVGPGDRIGLVGPNGIGKSTLLRVLAGLEEPDSGTVERRPPHLLVGYLPQEPDARPGETVLTHLARRTGVEEAEARVDALARDAASPAYHDALERFVALGGGDLEARAAETCAEVGLGGERLEQEMTTLSGGQRARAALAAILLARFDVFLLDEPTNDLDFDGLERLEERVGSLPGGAVIVSHDRAFLERTIRRVVEIEEGTQSAHVFAGGWTAYLEARETARRHAYEAFGKFETERRDLEERARRIRSWAEKGARSERRKPSDSETLLRRGRIDRTEKQASRVRAIERRVERLGEVDKPYEPWELRLHLAPERRSGEVVVRLTDVVIERGTFVLGPLSVEVGWGERVAVTGPNGSGKTTLLEAMLGRMPLHSGERYAGPGVVFGELTQTREAFASDRSVLELFVEGTGMRTDEARTLLAKFRIGPEELFRPCRSLSPGERTRAVLALLSAQGANCLVCDEPTNHLDLPAIEQLEAALSAFEGTLILVTHDRRFLEAVRCDRSIEL